VARFSLAETRVGQNADEWQQAATTSANFSKDEAFMFIYAASKLFFWRESEERGASYVARIK
jgi:hypothetical protein